MTLLRKPTRREAAEAMRAAIADRNNVVRELRGNLLVCYVLLKRLGGEQRVTAKDILEADGAKIHMSFDPDTEDYIFTAVDPVPEPQSDATGTPQ